MLASQVPTKAYKGFGDSILFFAICLYAEADCGVITFYGKPFKLVFLFGPRSEKLSFVRTNTGAVSRGLDYIFKSTYLFGSGWSS